MLLYSRGTSNASVEMFEIPCQTNARVCAVIRSPGRARRGRLWPRSTPRAVRAAQH